MLEMTILVFFEIHLFMEYFMTNFYKQKCIEFLYNKKGKNDI